MQSKIPRRERSRSRTSATNEGGRRLHATHRPASPRREREAELRPNRTLISPRAASPTDVDGDRFCALKSSATAVKRQPPSDEAAGSSPSATVPSLPQAFGDEDIGRFVDIAAPPPAGGADLMLFPPLLVKLMDWWGGASRGPAFSAIFRDFPNTGMVVGIFREFPRFSELEAWLAEIWRPRRDSNPRCRRERAESWARLDDGDARRGPIYKIKEGLVSRVGFEPTTHGLKARCSTT